MCLRDGGMASDLGASVGKATSFSPKTERSHSIILHLHHNLPAHSRKAYFLIPVCGKGNYSVYCRAPSKENGQFVPKTLEHPDGFQVRVFKGSFRGGGGKI